MARRILVTGASGLVGGHAVRSLAEAGHTVFCMSRAARPDTVRVRWIQSDFLTAEFDAILAMAKPETVLHAAWETRHGYFWGAPENLDWVAQSLLFLRASSKAGVQRFVGAGTWAEYDWTAPGVLDEGASPLAPATFYGVAKDAFRRAAESFCSENGIEFGWGRIAMLYGAGEGERRFVASLARALVAGEPADMGSGVAVRDFMDARDVGRALAALTLSDVSGPVNLGSGEAVTLGEVGRRIAHLAGRPDLLRVGARADPPNEPPDLRMNVARLRDDVGFRPEIDLDRGLQDALAFWRGALHR